MWGTACGRQCALRYAWYQAAATSVCPERKCSNMTTANFHLYPPCHAQCSLAVMAQCANLPRARRQPCLRPQEVGTRNNFSRGLMLLTLDLHEHASVLTSVTRKFIIKRFMSSFGTRTLVSFCSHVSRGMTFFVPAYVCGTRAIVSSLPTGHVALPQKALLDEPTSPLPITAYRCLRRATSSVSCCTIMLNG